MASLIRGFSGIDVETLEGSNEEVETQFAKLWGQTKYYLETVHQVEFK